MNNWKYEKLSKLCFRIGDGLHGTPEYSEESDVYFINGNNLKNGKIEINENTKKVTSEELSKNFIQLNTNTLLLSINGTIGGMAFFNEEKVMLGKSAAYLNFKTNINKFYYYYFQLLGVQEHFYNVATGSTIKNLSLKSIQDFEVPVPDKNIWEGISKILCSLDAKIELNNKINLELEAMAKTLYDYWFVQFDFPDANGKPYKTSGGKMVWSEELKREIPVGWEVGMLLDLCSKIGDGIHGTPIYVGDSEYSFINGNNLKNGFIQIDNETKKVSLDEYKKYFIQLNESTILLSINGTLGNLALYTGEKVMLGKSSAFINCNENNRAYCYQFLKQNHMPNLFWNIATGSTIKNLSLDSIKKLKILKPNNNLIKQFYTKTKSFDDKRINVFFENQELSSLRDWLLPMLMNGQVSVGGVAKEYKIEEEVLGRAAEPIEKYS